MTEAERLELTRRAYWARQAQQRQEEQGPAGDFDVTDEILPPVRPWQLPTWNGVATPGTVYGPATEQQARTAAEEEESSFEYGDFLGDEHDYSNLTADTNIDTAADIDTDATPEVQVEDEQDEQEKPAPAKRSLWQILLVAIGVKPKQPKAPASDEHEDEATDATPEAEAEAEAEDDGDTVWETDPQPETEQVWEADPEPQATDELVWEDGTDTGTDTAAADAGALTEWGKSWGGEVEESTELAEVDESTLSKKELRAKRKAEAVAARAEAGGQKITAAERKRLALVAKEEKERKSKRLDEAAQEEKIEADEARSRIRREKKQRKEWERNQKRRDAIRKNGGKEGFWQGTSKPKPMEIANAVRSLAIILEVNPAEIEAVKMMAEEFAGNRIGDAFDRIYDRLVKDNLTLVDAFEPEDLFPPVVHNMLRVGAKTGKPGPSLRTAVDLLDSGNDNARKMRNAIREPLILAVLSLVVLFITSWTVMPIFIDMYEALNMEVGMFSAFIMVFSEVTVWVLGISGVAAILLGIWWFVHGRWDMRVRIAIDRWKLHAPLTGKSEQSGEAFQLFNIVDSYMSVGATERETLLGAASAITNRAIRRHLRATVIGLSSGEKTFAQFLDDDMFPRLAKSILSTGQRTGQSGQAIKNLRRIYENESKIEGEQSVEKVVGLVSAISATLFTVTATIVSIPPLEIFGATLGYSG